MVRTQIQLTEEQHRRLRMLAAEKRVSVANLVRQSVDRLLKETSDDKDALWERSLGAIGMFRSDRSDVSARHDDYLAAAYAEEDDDPPPEEGQQEGNKPQ